MIAVGEPQPGQDRATLGSRRGPGLKAVAALCDRFLDSLPESSQREAIGAVRRDLLVPLRIAIAGRVKAGKSTLVNALIGQRVAPTGVQECTKVVTWFAYGSPERVEVVTADGRSSVPLVQGRIPEPLGVPIEEVQRLEVFLSRSSLREVTYIDTPGLASLNAQYSERTEEMLLDKASRSATRRADALVFLVAAGGREDDVQALRAFHEMSEGTGTSVATAVAALSRADQVGGGEGDPMLAAAEIAGRQAHALRAVAADVIPVAGLLAETADTGTLEERDAIALRALAAVDHGERETMLFSHESFKAGAGLPTDQAERLLDALDLFGLRLSLDLIDGGVSGAGDLERALRDASGIGGLRDLLGETFARRAETLRAHSALAELSEIAWWPAAGPASEIIRELREQVVELWHSPDMRTVGEIWAAQAAAGGDIMLPAELEEDIVALSCVDDPAARLGLASEASPQAVVAAATEAAARWRLWHNLEASTDMESRLARTMYRGFEAIAAGASAPRQAAG